MEKRKPKYFCDLINPAGKEKEIREWAKANGFVLVKRTEFNFLQDCTYKLSKLDRSFKNRLFNDDGEVFALQG